MTVIIDGTNGITTPGLTDTADASVSGNLTVTGNTTGTGYIRASGLTTNLYPLVSGTAVASTSGTSIDYTSIPSWVKRITVMFNGVSLSGTSDILVQIGSGSVTSTGYLSNSGQASSGGTVTVLTSTAGFVISSGNAARAVQGVLQIFSINGTLTTSSGSLISGTTVVSSAGSVTLSGAIDRVRITTVNGTDTFDAGTVNILYE